MSIQAVSGAERYRLLLCTDVACFTFDCRTELDYFPIDIGGALRDCASYPSTAEADDNATTTVNAITQKLVICDGENNLTKTLGLAWPLISPLYKWSRDMMMAKIARNSTASDADVLKSQSLHLADPHRPGGNGTTAAQQTDVRLAQSATVVLLATPFCATAWNVRKASFLRHLTTVGGSDGDLLLAAQCWAGAAAAVSCSRSSAAPAILASSASCSPASFHAILAACRSELRFISLVQSKHRKAGEAWAHRRWVVDGLLIAVNRHGGAPAGAAASPSSPTLQQALFEILAAEAAHCAACASTRPRNYYAWTHRGLVLRWLHEVVHAGWLRHRTVGADAGAASAGGDARPTEANTAGPSAITIGAADPAIPMFLSFIIREWASVERVVRSSQGRDYSAWHHKASLLEACTRLQALADSAVTLPVDIGSTDISGDDVSCSTSLRPLKDAAAEFSALTAYLIARDAAQIGYLRGLQTAGAVEPASSERPSTVDGPSTSSEAAGSSTAGGTVDVVEAAPCKRPFRPSQPAAQALAYHARVLFHLEARLTTSVPAGPASTSPSSVNCASRAAADTASGLQPHTSQMNLKDAVRRVSLAIAALSQGTLASISSCLDSDWLGDEEE